MDAFAGAVWFKSSRSGGSGSQCVEVAVTAGVIGVRDTKDRDGGTLAFARDEWATFINGIKDGEFDR
jgi:hypothetical protein